MGRTTFYMLEQEQKAKNEVKNTIEILEDDTKDDLLKKAKENELEVTTRIKKDEIIEVIEKHNGEIND